MYLRYGLQTMRERLRSSVEKARHLDRFLSHVLQVTNDILRLPTEEQVKKRFLRRRRTYSLYALDISQAR